MFSEGVVQSPRQLCMLKYSPLLFSGFTGIRLLFGSFPLNDSIRRLNSFPPPLLDVSDACYRNKCPLVHSSSLFSPAFPVFQYVFGLSRVLSVADYCVTLSLFRCFFFLSTLKFPGLIPGFLNNNAWTPPVSLRYFPQRDSSEGGFPRYPSFSWSFPISSHPYRLSWKANLRRFLFWKRSLPLSQFLSGIIEGGWLHQRRI